MKIPNIQLLSEKVINHIAAGEVVERPASVVKELIENAIDAQATDIVLELDDGGKNLIRVSDNGCGMNKEDALLALERHATSKITDLNDLANIITLGFRGEGIPSIAAVSRLEIITKASEDEGDKNDDTSDVSHEGTRIIADAGNVKKIERASCPAGTTITVKDLFYNTPARKKFLNAQQVETRGIIDYVSKVALMYPHIFFTVFHNKKCIINSPGTIHLLEKISHIWGRNVADSMLSVTYSEDGINIKGYVSKPHEVRKTRKHQSIFVNGRYVRNECLSEAVESAYEALISKGSYPVMVLSITINPAEVDVNVHPQKLEVQFRNKEKTMGQITTSVKNALSGHSLIPAISSTKEQQVIAKDSTKAVETIRYEYSPVQPRQTELTIHDPTAAYQRPEQGVASKDMPDICIIGQIAKKYILAQCSNDLIVVDQHAAHERIRYEQISTALAKKAIESQELISPFSLELSAKEISLLLPNRETFEKLGFKFELFGKNTIIIRAVPIVFETVSDKNVIHDTIEEILLIKKSAKAFQKDIKKEIISSLACHCAVRANEELTLTRMTGIIRELFACETPYTCPHGRPTTVKITEDELNKMFKRK